MNIDTGLTILFIVSLLLIVYLPNSTVERYTVPDVYNAGVFLPYRPQIIPNSWFKPGDKVLMDHRGGIITYGKICKNTTQSCEGIECPSMFPKHVSCYQCPKFYYPVRR